MGENFSEARLVLTPYKLIATLAVVALTLSVLGVTAAIVQLVIEPERWNNVLRLFALGNDGNIPTWFSSGLLAFCGLALALIASIRAKLVLPDVRHWAFLSFLFFMLSIDDVATIHELSGRFLRNNVEGVEELGGLFYYAWVLFAAPLVLVLAVVYLPWFFRLPSRTRLLSGAAAICFLSGALGLEMVNSAIDEARGTDNFQYQMLTAAEEMLEMAGPLIFLYALLRHLEEWVGSVTFDIGSSSN